MGAVNGYSQTAGSNTTIAGVSVAEGWPAENVNNAIRGMAADIKKFADDIGGKNVTTGGTTAYLVTTQQTLTSPTLVDGVQLAIVPNATNTGASTLNADSLGTKKIRRVTSAGDVDIGAGDMLINGQYTLRYDASADSASGAWILLNPEPFVGSIVQRSVGTYATSADLTTVTPVDDTIPTITEGTEIISVSHTPRSTTNRLRARFSGTAANTTAGSYTVAALHLNGGAAVQVGIHESRANSIPGPIVFEYEWVPGSVSAQTIAVRVGPSANTSRMNGTGAARLFGGVAVTYLVVEEMRI